MLKDKDDVVVINQSHENEQDARKVEDQRVKNE